MIREKNTLKQKDEIPMIIDSQAKKITLYKVTQDMNRALYQKYTWMKQTTKKSQFVQSTEYYSVLQDKKAIPLGQNKKLLFSYLAYILTAEDAKNKQINHFLDHLTYLNLDQAFQGYLGKKYYAKNNKYRERLYFLREKYKLFKQNSYQNDSSMDHCIEDYLTFFSQLS